MVVVQAGWHALGMKASGPWVPPMNAAVGEWALAPGQGRGQEEPAGRPAATGQASVQSSRYG
jgi:hypothetical protein